MSVVAFPAGAEAVELQALVTAVFELHALITLDPVLGASPVRAYFVLNPVAKEKIAECIADAGRDALRGPYAYVVVAYDFPFALHQLTLSGKGIAEERAKAIVSASAAVQEPAFRAAAEALNLVARSIPSFDSAALKAVFFPTTQETVTHVLRLSLL